MALKSNGPAGDNLEKLRRATKRGSGGAFWRPKANEDNTVRILDEPGVWQPFDEHYTDEDKFFPCDSDSCKGCDEGARASTKFAMNVLEVSTGTVYAAIMPKSVANQLMTYYEKSSRNPADRTMTDMDYDIDRQGAGKDTEYTVLPTRGSKPIRVSKYDKDKHDLVKLLEARIAEVNGFDVPTDEAPTTARATAANRRAAAVEDEDEDDPFIDMDRAELKAHIKSLDPEFVILKRMTEDDLRSIARDLGDPEPVEDEDDDEPDDEDEPVVTRQRKAAPSSSATRTSKPVARPAAKAASKPAARSATVASMQRRKPVRRTS